MGNKSTNYINIPYLEHDKNKNIDIDKINNFVIHAFNNYLDTDGKRPRIIIRVNHGLTPEELEIVKGIILVNGIDYYEVSEDIELNCDKLNKVHEKLFGHLESPFPRISECTFNS